MKLQKDFKIRREIIIALLMLVLTFLYYYVLTTTSSYVPMVSLIYFLSLFFCLTFWRVDGNKSNSKKSQSNNRVKASSPSTKLQQVTKLRIGILLGLAIVIISPFILGAVFLGILGSQSSSKNEAIRQQDILKTTFLEQLSISGVEFATPSNYSIAESLDQQGKSKVTMTGYVDLNGLALEKNIDKTLNSLGYYQSQYSGSAYYSKHVSDYIVDSTLKSYYLSSNSGAEFDQIVVDYLTDQQFITCGLDIECKPITDNAPYADDYAPVKPEYLLNFQIERITIEPK